MKLIKIGRSSENDIVIDDDTNISRHHAELFIDDEERVFLTDLNSANGTYVNGKKLLGSEFLKENDIVKIGKTVLPWKNYLDMKNKPKIQNDMSKDEILDQKTDFVANNKEDEIEKKQETLKASSFWIVFGFIFSILGGWIGFGFGLNYALRNYNSETKTNGWIMIGIGLLVNFLYIIGRN